MTGAGNRGQIIPLPTDLDNIDAARVQAFLRHVPCDYRDALEKTLQRVCRSPFPVSITDLYGNTNGGAAKQCHEPRARQAHSLTLVEAMRRQTLAGPEVSVASAALVQVVTPPWSEDARVLKAALMLPGGLQPVECTRVAKAADVSDLMVRFYARMVAADRPLPIVTTDPDSASHAIYAALRGMPWVGRLPTDWKPPVAVGAQWSQPCPADILDVLDALSHGTNRPEITARFQTLISADQRLILDVHGPTDHGHVYARTRGRKTTRGHAQRDLAARAADLDAIVPTLSDFPIEHFEIHHDKPHSYNHVIAKLLLAQKFAVWDPAADPAPTAQPLPKHGAKSS